MKPGEPDPVKLFVGLLYGQSETFNEAKSELLKLFGQIDFTSQEFGFAATDYYQAEMGSPLFRRFLSFAQLVNPGDLASIKIATNELEDGMAVAGKRQVNLDPGYLDFNKVVLASAKYNGQKIYLGDGIYADPTLLYQKGEFEAHASAFPDFKSGSYRETFLAMRLIYKTQRIEIVK